MPAELVVTVAACVVCAASVAYAVWAALCVRQFAARAPLEVVGEPAVTLLKPLCGDDHELEANLRSYFEQDYANYQIVFGVREATDPALGVVHALLRAYPAVDAEVVIDGRVTGTNFKVSNLIHMVAKARHGILVCSDSDVRVGPRYLRRVVRDFERPEVGAVTCVYTGVPSPDLPSRLGALFINDWFLPSALVHARTSALEGCFGQTMAVRREVLEAGGGFEAINSCLADDYVLGQLVRAQGLRIALSSYVVENVVHERSVGSLLRHELRWGRTFRLLQPVGYTLSFLSHPAALGVLGAAAVVAVGGSVPAAVAILLAGVGAKLALHFAVRTAIRPRHHGPAWLVPLRDLLEFGVWVASHLGRRVRWRGTDFKLEPDGTLSVKRHPATD